MMLREPNKNKKTTRALGATRVAQGSFRVCVYISSALINEIFCNERDPRLSRARGQFKAAVITLTRRA